MLPTGRPEMYCSCSSKKASVKCGRLNARRTAARPPAPRGASAEVQNLAVRRVPKHAGLARTVRAGHEIAQRKPAQRCIVLPVEGQVGPIIGMNEQVILGLKIVTARLQKAEMFSRHGVESRAVAVRIERRLSAAFQPKPQVAFSLPRVQHHLVVVAENRY